MAGEAKGLWQGAFAIPVTSRGRRPGVARGFRRYIVWAQTVIVFVFLEFALWEPTTRLRNRWAIIAMCTLLALVLTDRPSLERLGLRLPKTFGASVVLGIGFALVLLMVMLVNWAGGQIPA